MGVSAVAALRIALASLLLLCSFMGSSLFCLMLTPGPAVRLQIRTLVLLLQNRQCKVQGSKSKVPSTQHPTPSPQAGVVKKHLPAQQCAPGRLWCTILGF